MDDRGNILLMDEVLKKPLKEQEKFIPIPDEELPTVQAMNRKQRRDWYKRQKRGCQNAKGAFGKSRSNS